MEDLELVAFLEVVFMVLLYPFLNDFARRGRIFLPPHGSDPNELFEKVHPEDLGGTKVPVGPQLTELLLDRLPEEVLGLRLRLGELRPRIGGEVTPSLLEGGGATSVNLPVVHPADEEVRKEACGDRQRLDGELHGPSIPFPHDLFTILSEFFT